MKKLIMVMWISLLGITACSENEDSVRISNVTSSSGNQISMDGIWKSDCVDFGDFRLQEQFDFSGHDLQISIFQYMDNSCSEVVASEVISIDFEVIGTIEVNFNGSVVIANKISGTETSSKNNNTEAFQQTFYIDDSSGEEILYHGVFEDDGGKVSNDGYPSELHPFEITHIQ